MSNCAIAIPLMKSRGRRSSLEVKRLVLLDFVCSRFQNFDSPHNFGEDHGSTVSEDHIEHTCIGTS